MSTKILVVIAKFILPAMALFLIPSFMINTVLSSVKTFKINNLKDDTVYYQNSRQFGGGGCESGFVKYILNGNVFKLTDENNKPVTCSILNKAKK